MTRSILIGIGLAVLVAIALTLLSLWIDPVVVPTIEHAR